MHNDATSVSDAPLYLVPDPSGSGRKRLVRRPHPPPTTAPLPDDFDAITVTQQTSVLGDQIRDDRTARPGDGIDYDDMTVGGEEFVALQREGLRESTGAERQRDRTERTERMERVERPKRTASPTRSVGMQELGGRVAKLSMGPGKASSVAGMVRDRDRARDKSGHGEHSRNQSGGTGAKGPTVATGRNELVQRKVLEDGPDRTISLWREDVAVTSNASEAGVPGGRGVGRDSDEVDSHKGRRHRSSFTTATPIGLGTPSTNSRGIDKERGMRNSLDIADRSLLQRSNSSISASSPIHRGHVLPPETPRQHFRRSSSNRMPANGPASPTSQSQSTVLTSPTKGPFSSSVSSTTAPTTTITQTSSAGVRRNDASFSPLDRLLDSCQPSLLHIAPILDSLGVRDDAHLRALARMREETRDREVKEEALRAGVTVVEWAIFVDRLIGL